MRTIPETGGLATWSGQPAIACRANQPAPLLHEDQSFSYDIKKVLPLTIAWGEKKILSADQHIVGILGEADGEPFMTIEPEVAINDVAIVPNSGMILPAKPAFSGSPSFESSCKFIAWMIFSRVNTASVNPAFNTVYSQAMLLLDASYGYTPVT